jgi:hypothetical protein
MWGVSGVVVGSTLLWVVIALYLAGSLYWLYEVLVHGLRYEEPHVQYGPGDVQVRFLTIDNEAVVRQSVAELPPGLDDVWVVAEEPMDVPGANVAVVPDEFECEATNKGRALEWARRHVPCDREFVLFLDEDSHLKEFGGLPDADIVQLTERPLRTSSLLCFLAELNRIGFQIEQTAFPNIEVPLYACGAAASPSASPSNRTSAGTTRRSSRIGVPVACPRPRECEVRVRQRPRLEPGTAQPRGDVPTATSLDRGRPRGQ